VRVRTFKPEDQQELLEETILEWRALGPAAAWNAIYEMLGWWFAARGLDPEAQRVDRTHLEIHPVPWRTGDTPTDGERSRPRKKPLVPEQLTEDMRELLEALNRCQAQYLVIGAHAVGVYAEPRGTKDLDIWVNPTKENAKRVYAALKEFGAPLFGATQKTFAQKQDFLVIGVAPNRIDILKSIPGLGFRACWKNRRTFEIGGTTANFPSLEDLLTAKLAAGRPQDLVDAAKLRKALEVERKQPPAIEQGTNAIKPKTGRSSKRRTRQRRKPDPGQDHSPGIPG
jgi:hypothetical protein